jgi:regulator of protease activity HflC (stomatin/prohibitin superfamily)
MFSLTSYVIILASGVAFVLIAASVKILREYERAVVFTLGRFQKVRGPGLVLLIPFVRKWCAWICASRSSRYRPRT